MSSQFSRLVIVICLTLFFFLPGALLQPAWTIAADESTDEGQKRPVVTHSTIDRLKRARLANAHRDVQRFREQRRILSLKPNYLDIRSILHAHAEDSTHTGGTRPEMLADAIRVGVQAILLTDHHRPPRDFITDSWQGIRDGVLFIPGSEARGFLIYPTGSVIDRMSIPLPEFLDCINRDRGMAFLSHIEERPDHSMDGLTGLEIYNRHADAKKDTAGILALLLKMTDPESLQELEECLRLFPDELFAFQVTRQSDYLEKWDKETQHRRLTGVAANDCHHNQILIMKVLDENTVAIGTNVDTDDKFRKFSALLRPGIRKLTRDRKPGDILARLDLDPYHRSFLNVCTHILAPDLSESSIRMALRDGHAYVSHDWMCDPTGFSFALLAESETSQSNRPVASMGDEVDFIPGLKLFSELPVPSRIRLYESGKLRVDQDGDSFRFDVERPGVYRIEAWLRIDGEDRPWIYSNPIYIRGRG